MSATIKDTIRHYLNPLHIYCRLARSLGSDQAMTISRLYEESLYGPIAENIR